MSVRFGFWMVFAMAEMSDEANKAGLLLIISGPSGVGKTTIAHRVEKTLGGVFSVSMTTRPKAAKDREGEDYYFVTKQRFEQAVAAGELLEHASVFENHYGTPRGAVEASLATGELVILEIDVQGAIQVKANKADAYAIFILPPSEEELLTRLRGRKRDDEATIQRRFAKAKAEIAKAKESGVYDAFVTNDDLDHAVSETIAQVQTQRARRSGCGSRGS